jgi:hypothetical protein
VKAMPATVELCQRLRDGSRCLGHVYRSGEPEQAYCFSCGGKEDGVVYVKSPEGDMEER